MSYSWYKDAEAIINEKKKYEGSKDSNVQKTAHNTALEYYNKLKATGNSAVAEQLSKMNAEQSTKYLNNLKKTGKTELRPYYYSKGKAYGMSESDIDNLIKWDNDTKEITFAGKKIKAPDAIVDGASYYDDASLKELDSAWDDFVKRENVQKPSSSYVGEHDEYTNSYYKKWLDSLYGDYKNIDEEAKATGEIAKNSTLAQGASSNGGNIDSYSAANAERQRLVSSMAVKNNSINNILKVMQQWGVDINGVFDRSQTAQNNELQRQVAKSEVTGLVPSEWNYDNNIYFQDGKLIDVNTDYSVIVDNLKGKLSQTTDETERANIQAQIDMANEARNYKIRNYKEYAKYADTMELPSQRRTESSKQFDKTIGLEKYNTDAGIKQNTDNISVQKEINKDNNAANVTMANIESDTRKYESDNALKSSQYTTNAELSEYDNKISKDGQVVLENKVIPNIKNALLRKYGADKVFYGGDEENDVITGGNGVYRFNRDVMTYTDIKAYAHVITDTVMKEESLSYDDRVKFLLDLGIDQEIILGQEDSGD